MTNPNLPNHSAYVALGRALAAVRRKAGITQVELGEAIDVRSEFVSAVERADRGLRWYTLTAWVVACGSTLRELAELIES